MVPRNRLWKRELVTFAHDTGLEVVVCHFPPGTSTTRTGLTVRSELDHSVYQTGFKVTDQEMKQVPLVRHQFHGNWNYTLKKSIDELDQESK